MLTTFLKRNYSAQLSVPYVHYPLTTFNKLGIPDDLVRKTEQNENWSFWTSSDAFRADKPLITGLTYVPYGEQWIMNNNKILTKGFHLLLPLFSKIKSIKTCSTHVINMGVITDDIKGKDETVNGYAVCSFKVTDALKVF